MVLSTVGLPPVASSELIDRVCDHCWEGREVRRGSLARGEEDWRDLYVSCFVFFAFLFFAGGDTTTVGRRGTPE